MADAVKVLAFDLGGVLLQLGDPLSLFRIDADAVTFHEKWSRSESVRALERGAIGIEEFSGRVVEELELPLDAREFRRRFDAWPERLFPGALETLDRVPASYRRVLLSNINADHWNRDDIAGALVGRFERLFLSYETGLMKPDADAFRQVIDFCGCPPAAILYVDDGPLNVQAAAASGMQAHLARGIADVTRILTRAGVLGSDQRK